MKSIPSMSLKTKAMKSLGRKILCVLLSGVFFGDTIAWAEAPFFLIQKHREIGIH